MGDIAWHVRRRHTLGNTACLTFLGAAALSGATLAPEGYALATGAGGALLSLGSAATGAGMWRHYDRREVLVSLRRAIAPQAGNGATVVPLRGWTARWGGRPNALRVRYDPVARSEDPNWVQLLMTAVQRVLGEPYEITDHDWSRGVITMSLLDTSALQPEPDPDPQQVRTSKMLSDLIGPTAQLTGFEAGEDGNPVRFTAAHEVPAKLAARGYRTRIERTVSEINPGRWRAHWDQEKDTVTFELMPSFPEKIDNPGERKDIPDSDALLAAYGDVRIPYGTDVDGNTVSWRPAREPHMMVVGKTGTGKSVTQHTLLVEITSYGWPVWVVDGKGVEFLGFREWPNVQIVGTTVPVQVAILERAWQVMEHRYKLITEGKARETQFEPLVVFVDEWADFRANLMGWYEGIKQKGDPRKPLVLDRLGSIARKGRTARVHIVFGTQRPDAEYFGGDMRDNFPMRASMGRLSPQAAQMVWENPVTGVTVPRNCIGRATAVNPAGDPVEVQTYWTPDPRKTAEGTQDAQILERLRPLEALQPRLVVELPEAEADWDEKTGDPITVEPSYTDYANARWHLASTRPDLDVLAAAADDEAGREASSPMALLLGMRSPLAGAGAGTGTTGGSGAAGGTSSPAEVEDQVKPDAYLDDDDGYTEASQEPVSQVEIGWLIRVEEAAAGWATVDEEPTEDPMDEGSVVLCWRDDTDDVGSLVVDADDLIEVRIPALEPVASQ